MIRINFLNNSCLSRELEHEIVRNNIMCHNDNLQWQIFYLICQSLASYDG